MSNTLTDRPERDETTDKLAIVSNRQPYRHSYSSDGSLEIQRPTGGLTAGLDPVMQRLGGVWVAWGDGDADFDVTDEDDCVEVPPEDPSYTLKRIALSEEQVDGYYSGYANQALWPLCHVLTGNVRFDLDHWNSYWEVNRRFAEETADIVDSDSTVWIQDYHFGLAPAMLRDRTDAMIMQFWHIPWPSPDVFQVCPTARELLEGMLGNDLLAFHLPQYSQHFLDCVGALVPDASVDQHAGRIRHGAQTTRVLSFPMGVDAESLREHATTAGDTAREFRQEHNIPADRTLIVGVDRLDYTKGIRERLAGLAYFWETRPERRGEFTYVQKSSESRSEIQAYKELQEDVRADIEAINERFGSEKWRPVIHTTDYLSQETLCGLYRDAAVALITSVRDGMNLVAKEYIAAQIENDGMVVLSELAGASEQLGDDVITVNPYDEAAIAAAIKRALDMDETERQRRMRNLRANVTNTDIVWWIDSILDAAAARREQMENLTA